VGILAFRHELQPLDNAKSMLFVDDHKAEFPEDSVLFDQRVRADDDVDLAYRDLLEQLLSLRLLDPATHSANSIIQRSEDSFRVEKVLLGEDLGRGHQ